MRNTHLALPLLTLLPLAATIGGCQSAYYGAWEKLGVHKRDILVERVEKARDSQEQAKTQFTDALEQFRSVVKIDGGNLAAKYDKLKSELDSSQARADEVSKRIESVKAVSDALFTEWQGELDQYQNPDLRQASERELRNTRTRYSQLIAAMERAEAKMKPVLVAFNDQVLFLKHNLNARAIASLQGVSISLEKEINILIEDMNRSIDEANEFIKEMGKS